MPVSPWSGRWSWLVRGPRGRHHTARTNQAGSAPGAGERPGASPPAGRSARRPPGAGHVDGVGRVVRRATEGDALLLDLAVPKDVARVSIPLGSVTVDGVSLTVNRVVRRGIIQVSLIPHTRASTTLGDLVVGARVHLEGDLIGKYLQALGSRVRAGR
ncbi:MAG: hypothetical protein R2909_04785 [Gemmatimonadales bacterium]